MLDNIDQSQLLQLKNKIKNKINKIRKLDKYIEKKKLRNITLENTYNVQQDILEKDIIIENLRDYITKLEKNKELYITELKKNKELYITELKKNKELYITELKKDRDLYYIQLEKIDKKYTNIMETNQKKIKKLNKYITNANNRIQKLNEYVTKHDKMEKIIQEQSEEIYKLKNTILSQENIINTIQCPYKTLQLKGFTDKKNYLYYLQNSECAYCFNRIPFKKMTKEHLIPKSKGGTDDIGNICLVCYKCNQIRANNMEDFEFIDTIRQRLEDHIWWYKH